MSEYHSMKRQALLRTVLASAIGLYAVVCTVTTTLSLMAQ
jgi:hypothetical protein